MEHNQGLNIISFLTDFGLPTALCFFLLVRFQRSLDDLTGSINKLIGVVISITKDKDVLDGGGG